MISIHIEGQTPDEIKGILAGLAAHYAGGTTAPPPPAAVPAPKKDAKPAAEASPSPVASPAPKTDEMPTPAPKTDAPPAVAPKLGPTPLPAHTRDSIKAAIQAAKLAKPVIVALLATVNAKKLDEVSDDKVQALGNAVAIAVNTPVAPAPPAAAPAPAAEGAFTRESVMPLYVDAMAKDRPGLVKLLGDFGATKLAVLEDSKIPEFGLALKKFLTAAA